MNRFAPTETLIYINVCSRCCSPKATKKTRRLPTFWASKTVILTENACMMLKGCHGCVCVCNAEAFTVPDTELLSGVAQLLSPHALLHSPH